MSLDVTRGGLAPARIINLTTKEEVKFMFNPFEYTIKKTNTWEKEDGKGRNVPKMNFQKGGAQTLTLTLYFDSRVTGQDVRGYTSPLWKMMMVEQQRKNNTTGKSSPPVVAFDWGKLYFKSVITSLSQKFTLFDEKGVPLRCQVDITLEQFVDEGEFDAQIPGQAPGQGAAPTTTVVEGQRLDHVAAQDGNPNAHRQIAEQNNINDPQNVPPGTRLRRSS